jgi:Asp-tRNA(Asn)/Glu-tRNA(Gln) amidotransferase A subunit family amidase
VNPEPALPVDLDLAVVGPMARTARDLTLLLDVMAGPDPLTRAHAAFLQAKEHVPVVIRHEVALHPLPATLPGLYQHKLSNESHDQPRTTQTLTEPAPGCDQVSTSS